MPRVQMLQCQRNVTDVRAPRILHTPAALLQSYQAPSLAYHLAYSKTWPSLDSKFDLSSLLALNLAWP